MPMGILQIMDRHLADGLDESLELPEANMQLLPPCSEQEFREQPHAQMERLDRETTPPLKTGPSMNTFHCRLWSLRHAILRYGFVPHLPWQPWADGVCSMTKNLTAPQQDLEVFQVVEDVRRLQIRLTSFRETLPATYEMTQRNMRQLCCTDEWVGFVILHSWICQLHIDLYSFALPEIKENTNSELLHGLPAGFLRKARGQAVGWAVNYSQLWESLQTLLEEQPRARAPLVAASPWIGACTVQSSKVLLLSKKYGLYSHLREHTSAPLRSGGTVDDTMHNALIQSNLSSLDNISHLLPRSRQIVCIIMSRVALLGLHEYPPSIRLSDRRWPNIGSIYKMKPKSNPFECRRRMSSSRGRDSY